MEKYLKILEEIETAKIDVTKLYLLSCFKYSMDNEKEEWKAVNYCYDLWLDTDADISLGRLADIVADNWEEIQNDEIDSEEIIEMCLDIM